MDSLNLTLISMLRAVVEVALFSLIGQGILHLFAGASRDKNVVYRLFKVITSPVTKIVRAITPRFIVDSHINLVAFFLLLWLWILLALAKRYVS